MTPTCHDDLVAVLQELPGEAGAQLHGLGSLPAQLQHTAERVLGLTTNTHSVNNSGKIHVPIEC